MFLSYHLNVSVYADIIIFSTELWFKYCRAIEKLTFFNYSSTR